MDQAPCFSLVQAGGKSEVSVGLWWKSQAGGEPEPGELRVATDLSTGWSLLTVGYTCTIKLLLFSEFKD